MLLQDKNLDDLQCNVFYRVYDYDANGDAITYEHTLNNGDYFEILLRLSAEKLISLVFDLDGYFVSLELREEARKKAVALMRRNYNGTFYIYSKNCNNLSKDKIDFYFDYYNNHVVINNHYAKMLMEEIYQIINSVKNKVEAPNHLAFLNNILLRKIQDLFSEDFYKKQGYLTPLSVLPPNVRPDNNHNYCIVQVACGCKVFAQRKKACGFCSSFGMKYHELSTDELEKHINKLLAYNSNAIKNANCVFLADGDPLCSYNIVGKMKYIKSKLPNIKSFEAFISTATILTTNSDQWGHLKAEGLRKVYWGVESADDVTLRVIDKPHNRKALAAAREILEIHEVQFDIIIMSGIGLLQKKDRTILELAENAHVNKTVEFINSSKCSSVFVSKLQITPDSMIAQRVNETVFPFNEDEMEIQYRSFVKKIDRPVRGSYGNQFVVERVASDEISGVI